jgi:hypothetical protein
MSDKDKTGADMLNAIGRALHGEDWMTALAADLGVKRETVRSWHRGNARLDADHGMFDRLLALVVQRKAALDAAEHELREWLQRNRGTLRMNPDRKARRWGRVRMRSLVSLGSVPCQ